MERQVLYGIYTEGRGHRLRGALPGGERGRRAVLELVWFFRARRVVRVLSFPGVPTSAAILTAGVIPKYAGCASHGVQWFKDRGQWHGRLRRTAPPAMIIFFDWDDENGQDGLSDHTGIVEKVENGRVYTIEGNSGDSVRQNSYPVGHYEVLGYGCPDF